MVRVVVATLGAVSLCSDINFVPDRTYCVRVLCAYHHFFIPKHYNITKYLRGGIETDVDTDATEI